MKTLFSVGTMIAFLGLAAASTFAQTQTTSSTSTSYIETSKLVGTKVKSSQGEEIGVVKDVVLDRSTGCMAYTVLSTGGGGGQVAGGGQVSGGGKLVSVPWSVYSPTSNASELTVTVDRERIYNAPVFDYARIDEYSRPEYISNVYSYYGVSGGAAVGVGVSGSRTTGTTTSTGAERTSGAATNAGARAGTSPGASPATSVSPSPAKSPMGTASPGRSPHPHATAGAASPHPTHAGRAHQTPSTRETPGARGGERETSPTEGARGTRERREETTPTSGRGETGTRSENERAPSEGSSGGEKAERATGSQHRERAGKRESTSPSEKPPGGE